MYKLFIFSLCLSASLSLVKCDLNKEEGEDCVWNIPDAGEFQGKCVNAKQCFTTLAKREEKPPVCSTKGGVTIVCCTDCELVNDTSNAVISPKSGVLWKDGRKFRDHCLQYLNDLPNRCPGYYGGIARYLITEEKCHRYSIWGVGGPPPFGMEPPSVNPYEALVGYGENVETAKWKTSGAIISDKYILTSGFDGAQTGGLQPKFVAVGVKKQQTSEHRWQTYVVKKIHVNPKYLGPSRYNYVALLELATPIEFNDDVFPACLPDPEDKFDMSVAEVTPFVDPNTNYASFENTRDTVKVTMLTAENCSAQLTSAQSPARSSFAQALPRGVDTVTQACYGSQETCMTVLGSPVVVNTYLDSCVNTVVGVKVFGESCGPAVYAKATTYVPWIESIVWP